MPRFSGWRLTPRGELRVGFGAAGRRAGSLLADAGYRPTARFRWSILRRSPGTRVIFRATGIRGRSFDAARLDAPVPGAFEQNYSDGSAVFVLRQRRPGGHAGASAVPFCGRICTPACRRAAVRRSVPGGSWNQAAGPFDEFARLAGRRCRNRGPEAAFGGGGPLRGGSEH